MKLMTARQKLQRRDEIIEQDGRKCLYCKLELDLNDCVIDHLDDNPFNNNPENHTLCHQKCNLEKRNNFDYKIIAQEKLEANQKRVLVSYLEDKSEYGNSPEIEHNVNVRQLVKQMLFEKTKTDGEILYSEALNGFSYLAAEKFGHCSQVTIRRHLDDLTSCYAPFMVIKNKEGKKVIIRRVGN